MYKRQIIYGVYDYIGETSTQVVIQYYNTSDRSRHDLKTLAPPSYDVEYDELNYTLSLLPKANNGNWETDIDKFWLVQFNTGMDESKFPQLKTALQLIVNDFYNAVPMYTTSAKRTYDHFLDPLKRLTPIS